MANTNAVDNAFLATLDQSLLTGDLDEAGVSTQVEASIRQTLDVSTSPKGTHIDSLRRESALKLLHLLVVAWRSLISAEDFPVDKMSLGYTAASAAKQITWFEAKDGQAFHACLTDPLKAVSGAKVPKEVVEDIIKAASKMYLVLRGATPKPVAISELPHRMLNLTPNPFHLDARSPPTVRLFQPGDRDYLPDYPTIRPPVMLRLGKRDQDTTTTADNKQSVPTGGTTDGVPGSSNDIQTNPSVTPSKAVGRGNFGHSNGVVWLEDELDFATTLLIVYRLTWNELTDATNEHFLKRPGLSNGKVVKRGYRSRDSVRQNHFLKFLKDNLHRLDEQSDPQDPSIDIDWAAEYQQIQGAESSEVDSSSGEEGVRPKVVQSGWVAVNAVQENSKEGNMLPDASGLDSSGESHDALGDIDEMMRREELGELVLTEDDVIA